MTRSNWTRLRTGLLLLAAALAAPALQAQTLLNVSYDPTRELYADFNKAFVAAYQKETGKSVEIKQSHGGSGSQARAVIDGLEADGVLSSSGHFAEPSDAGVIVTAISRHPDAEPQPTAALSGYYLLEVADRAAAEEYARRAPLYGTVEVRPLVEY